MNVKFTIQSFKTSNIHLNLVYCIAGKFDELRNSFRAFDERKFGELIDQPIDY